MWRGSPGALRGAHCLVPLSADVEALAGAFTAVFASTTRCRHVSHPPIGRFGPRVRPETLKSPRPWAIAAPV